MEGYAPLLSPPLLIYVHAAHTSILDCGGLPPPQPSMPMAAGGKTQWLEVCYALTTSTLNKPKQGPMTAEAPDEWRGTSK